MKNDIKAYITYADRRNHEVFWYNFNRLKKKAITLFEWINLPKEIDERYLELMLCENGYVCFFKDQVVKGVDTYFALQCTLGGRFNVYNIPTIYQIYTASGYQARRNASNSVIIYNNLMHTPTVPTLMYHAYNISNIERTIDINLNQLKRPYIFLVPENQKFSFQKLIADIKNNQDVIIGNKDLNLESVANINTITPNNTLELYNLKKRYYNEALTDLGINNLQVDKKERLVADEVSSNDEDVKITRNEMLAMRKMACKQINEMFGLNVDVRFRLQNEEVENKEEKEMKEEKETKETDEV